MMEWSVSRVYCLGTVQGSGLKFIARFMFFKALLRQRIGQEQRPWYGAWCASTGCASTGCASTGCAGTPSTPAPPLPSLPHMPHFEDAEEHKGSVRAALGGQRGHVVEAPHLAWQAAAAAAIGWVHGRHEQQQAAA